MPEETAIVQEPAPIEVLTAPAEAPSASSAGNTRIRWFELALVLLVAFSGFMVSSVYDLTGHHYSSPYSHASSYSLLLTEEVPSLLLLGYVLSRRKLRYRDLGLRLSFWDLGSGLVLIGVSYAAYYAGYLFLASWHLGASSSATYGHGLAPASAFQRIILVVAIVVNPFFEEMIVRAYLMTEIRELTGSWLLAVGASVAVQTSYHLYQGWLGALSLGFQFLIFSLYYARTRRIAPVIFAHGFFDLLGLVRML